MVQIKEGDLVKDKITGKKYYVLKIRDTKPSDTPLGKLANLISDDLKEDVLCKREDGVKGWKHSAELTLIRK